jgi:hypothetical protein
MRLSKIFYLVIFSVLLIGLHSNSAQAQGTGGDFGIGAMLGEPTGVSIKSWFNEQAAFDVGAAWSIAGRESLHMHADYLRHSWFEKNDQLAFYYGIGGRIIFTDEAQLGARVPLGLTYVFENVPFDLFLEAAPILDLTPDVELAGNGAVGIRYYL